MSDNFLFAEYDSDQVRIAFSGVDINRGAGASGYADGPFLKVVQLKESFIEVEGTDGSVSRSKTNTRLCEITIRLMQTSVSNAFLSAMVTTDEQGVNGSGVGTFVVEDLQGTTKFKANKAWVIKPADQEWDRMAKEREWTLHCIRTNIVVGGN